MTEQTASPSASICLPEGAAAESETPIKRYTQTSGALVETFDSFTGAPRGEWVSYRDHQRELSALREQFAEAIRLLTAAKLDCTYDSEPEAEDGLYGLSPPVLIGITKFIAAEAERMAK